MRVVFAGTPGFAAIILAALQASEHAVELVLTQPDRPAGRGLIPSQSEVKQLAQAAGIAVYQPASLKSPDVRARLTETRAQAIVVAAYGLILPKSILEVFPLGGINVHASMLPRWRGAAPIQRAILAGDEMTGVCVMRMNEGLDTGPVLSSEGVPIKGRDTAGSLHDRLAQVGARLLVNTLSRLDAGPVAPMIQDDSLATYAAKVQREEGAIDWTDTAIEIDRKIRAFNPVPGAHSFYNGVQLKVWRAEPAPSVGRVPPGTIATVDPSGILVACGAGTSLRLLELQRAGGKRMSVSDFTRGNLLSVGARLQLSTAAH